LTRAGLSGILHEQTGGGGPNGGDQRLTLGIRGDHATRATSDGAQQVGSRESEPDQGFGPLICGGCGKDCLDAQIGGHALPTPLEDEDVDRVVSLLHKAMTLQEIQADRMVLGGGLARNYPQIGERLERLSGIQTFPSATPVGLKSAAPFGLMHARGRGTDVSVRSR